jgi:hypothetical protein
MTVKEDETAKRSSRNRDDQYKGSSKVHIPQAIQIQLALGLTPYLDLYRSLFFPDRILRPVMFDIHISRGDASMLNGEPRPLGH